MVGDSYNNPTPLSNSQLEELKRKKSFPTSTNFLQSWRLTEIRSVG